METLLADENQIFSISNSLKLLIGLKTLDLSNNQLLSAPSFPGNLKELRLANNNLHKLPRLDLPHLQLLDVSHNHLQALPHFDTPALRVLLAEDNRVRQIMPDCTGFRLKEFSLDWFQYLPGHYATLLDDEEALAGLGKSSGSFVDVMGQILPGYTVDGGQEDQDDHKTALHLAIMQRDSVVTEILLKAGADPNAMDCFDTTALGFAVQGENVSGKITALMVHYADKINFGAHQN